MTPPRLARLFPAILFFSLFLAGPAPAEDSGIVQKLYDNAVQLLRSGKSDEALKGFEQIYRSYKSTPQASDSLYQAACFHYPTTDVDDLGAVSRDRIQRAAPLFELIRRDYGTSPRAPEALYRLGLLALEAENPKANPNEAYAAFTSVANVYPESSLVGDALYGAAVSQMRTGAFDAAIEDLSHLVELVGDRPLARRGRLALGYCLYQSGEFARAMEEYQRVRDLSPGKPEADQALERLTLLHRLRVLPAAGRTVTYRLDGTYPGRLEGLGLRSVTALALRPSGELLVADGKQGLGLILDSRGRPTEKLVFPAPQAAAVSRKGDPILLGAGTVLTGKIQQPLTRPDVASSRPVRDVLGAAVDRDGRIYVADGRTNEVLLFGRGLDFRAAIHRSAAGRLAAVRVGTDNRLYVLDSREKTITVYSEEKSVGRIRLSGPPAAITDPVALAVDDLGDLYVVDAGSGRIVVLEPGGQKVLAVLRGEKGKGGLSAPERVEVDHQGRVYVYDRRADAILRFQ